MVSVSLVTLSIPHPSLGIWLNKMPSGLTLVGASCCGGALVTFGVLGTQSGDLACGGVFGPLKPFLACWAQALGGH